MSDYIGAFVLALLMAYAIIALFLGMRNGTYNYFGRRISRVDNPVTFFIVMALMIVSLFIGARTMPYYLAVLLA